MRILHVSTRLILGGSQENTILSCEGQAMRGHEVHLAFGPIYGPEGSLLERVEAFNRAHVDNRIRTHIVPHLVREVRPAADARALRELRRLVRELRPDVVHTHSSKAGVLGRVAAWREGGSAGHVRVVHTIHGPPFMPIEGGATARAKVRLSNALYTFAERFAAKRCHVIVSVADAMTRQFLSRGIGRDVQYVTVASGMETEPFLNAAPGEDRASMRARLGLCEDDFVIGTVARLAQHKGHDDLLDALADDLHEHPHWRLLWVGDGWWRDRLIAKARALGIAIRPLDPAASTPASPASESREQVLLAGLVAPERIPGLMRAMDVLAHPSYREGLPRTVPQALLSGVCPIAYDCDGTPEVVRDGETGFLVPTGDRAALRAAVLRAAANPADRAAMAARGRDECARRFDVSRMIDALVRVYHGHSVGRERLK